FSFPVTIDLPSRGRHYLNTSESIAACSEAEFRTRLGCPGDRRRAVSMTNAEIAAALDELGVLYELDGAVKYRVLAYGTAAKAIRESRVAVAELAREGRAAEIAGVGKTLAEKIDALLATGEIPAAVKLKAKFPPTLIEVTRVPGVGAKTARRLFDELGISS